jgi:hypothetical protein
MQLLETYMRNLEECRKLALSATHPEQRRTIEEICAMWHRLAEERRKQLNLGEDWQSSRAS